MFKMTKSRNLPEIVASEKPSGTAWLAASPTTNFTEELATSPAASPTTNSTEELATVSVEKDFSGLPVPKMYTKDFDRVGCTRYVTMDGMSWIGNQNLWYMGRKLRIGVFADGFSNDRIDAGRGHWAVQTGRLRKCLVGIFNSWAEREILRLHLRNGGKAIWLMGCAFYKNFNKDCSRAICEGRLLVVSCFWIREWNFASYRYCCQLVAMCSGSLVFWTLDPLRYTDVVYKRAVANGCDVTLYRPQ